MPLMNIIKTKRNKTKLMQPQLTTLDLSPYANELVIIKVFAKEKPHVLTRLESNQKEISSLAKNMYKDGLMAEMNYLEGLQYSKNEEMDKLFAVLMHSLERYNTKKDTFFVHYRTILEAHQEYMENILAAQDFYDREFINELKEEQEKAQRRRSAIRRSSIDNITD